MNMDIWWELVPRKKLYEIHTDAWNYTTLVFKWEMNIIFTKEMLIFILMQLLNSSMME